MANPSVESGFVKEYEKGVHLAYQRQGSKLRGLVRGKGNVKGASTTFQKAGKGTAATKARHGKVPVMNVDHSSVECLLADYYAGEWNDALDDLKTNNDEKQIAMNSGAWALGRKTDELIVAALDTSTNYALTAGDGMTKAKVLAAFEALGAADVPDDGGRTCVIGWRQWSQLLDIEEFKDADYVGDQDLPWKNGGQAKRWLNTLWVPFGGLSAAGGVRLCHWFHKTAIGHASGKDVTSDITWHGDRASHFINNMMSQGAVMIDATGVVTLRCLES
ncbi:phage capsid protein [Ferrovibrio sp.]|uniref:phage capsid protein n=1 Tax=Ferrovibrio sp. TaxID=1917215 RepID=UPI003D0DFA37